MHYSRIVYVLTLEVLRQEHGPAVALAADGGHVRYGLQQRSDARVAVRCRHQRHAEVLRVRRLEHVERQAALVRAQQSARVARELL